MTTRLTAAAADDVYELPPVESVECIPDAWQSPATYSLETAVKCPHCEESIRSIRIVGLARSQVVFTSTMPRKGRLAVCSQCDAILGHRFGAAVRP